MPTTGPNANKARSTKDTTQDAELAILEQKELAKASFTADGALTKTTGIKRLAKTSAGAYTLAAPTANEEGAEVTLIADTAFAHVVTATGLINDGVTGGSKTTMTFAAFVGSSIRLVAMGLKWYVVSKNLVTIT
jgi:hypothetical protein